MELTDAILKYDGDCYKVLSLIDSREFKINKKGFIVLKDLLLKSKPSELFYDNERFLYSQFSDFISIGPYSEPRISNGGLEVISIENNQNCNLDCKHCYLGKKDKVKLSLDTFLEVVDSSKNLGAYSLAITGGEPFLDKDIFKKISYARNQNFKISISSNGIPLNKEKIEELKLLKVSGLTITFLGTKNDHEFIYGQGTYNNTVKILELIKESGIELSINYLLYNENYNNFASIITEINSSFNPKAINTTYISARGNALENPIVLLSESDIFNFLRKNSIENEFSKNKIKMGLNCSAGKKTVFIKSNGEVIPCVEFYSYPLGNVNLNSLENILIDNLKLKELEHFDIRKIDKCKNCINIIKCQGGCRGKSFQLTGDIYGLEDNACLLYK